MEQNERKMLLTSSCKKGPKEKKKWKHHTNMLPLWLEKQAH